MLSILVLLLNIEQYFKNMFLFNMFQRDHQFKDPHISFDLIARDELNNFILLYEEEKYSRNLIISFSTVSPGEGTIANWDNSPLGQ